jgi:hydroxymethylglutaryl-CoA lyase
MKLIECPRDAMQGIKQFIPTEVKTKYINSLLNIGFDTIDVGSFVSHKAIPQMQDTAQVLKQLNLSATTSKLLTIIANTRGAQEACAFDEVHYLGFPFSISETFQQRNANSSIAESLIRVEEIQSLCIQHKKELVVYISMAFGNPYGDLWNSDIVIEWTKKLSDLGVKTIALSDTIGVSNPENISYLFSNIIPEFKTVEIGAHLHSTKESALEKIDVAYKSGCQRFDVAIHGFGGCPMAKDDLTGNLATEDLEHYFEIKHIPLNLNGSLLQKAYAQSWDVFNLYH